MLTLHRLHHLGLLRVQSGVAQQVVHSDDRVERGAHLVAYRGEETSLRLVCGFLTTQRVEQPLHQLPNIHRQHNHAREKADAQRAVRNPIVVDREDQAEADHAPCQGVVEIRLAVTEAVAEDNPEINDVKGRSVHA